MRFSNPHGGLSLALAVAAMAMVGDISIEGGRPASRRRQDATPPEPVRGLDPRAPTPADSERIRRAELKRARKAAKLKERGRL